MLETARERLILLKVGIREKTIGKLYVAGNDMKMINGNVLYTMVNDKVIDNE